MDWTMFLRVVRANVSEGVKREYVRVVEAYRDHDGKTRHRTVINLGRRDLLATHLDLGKLGRLLHGDAADAGHVAREDVGAIGAWDWGPMLAARAMWSELGLDAILDNLARPDRREAVRLAEAPAAPIADKIILQPLRQRMLAPRRRQPIGDQHQRPIWPRNRSRLSLVTMPRSPTKTTRFSPKRRSRSLSTSGTVLASRQLPWKT